MDLPQQPFCFFVFALDALQRPLAFEFLAFEENRKHPFPIVPVHDLVGADVPYHHRASAILAFGDDAFEFEVLDWMIFRLKRRPCIFRF